MKSDLKRTLLYLTSKRQKRCCFRVLKALLSAANLPELHAALRAYCLKPRAARPLATRNSVEWDINDSVNREPTELSRLNPNSSMAVYVMCLEAASELKNSDQRSGFRDLTFEIRFSEIRFP